MTVGFDCSNESVNSVGSENVPNDDNITGRHISISKLDTIILVN